MPMPPWRARIAALCLVSLMFLVVPTTAPAAGTVLPVCPQGCPFSSISAALDEAGPGDTVRVGPGIYLEHILMKPGVTIQGEGSAVTIITGGGTDTVVRAYGDAIGPTAVLEGFTIIAGKAFSGGGIEIRGGASPTIRNNMITANTAGDSQSYGGGIFISGGSPIISGNTFSRNYATWAGGAISVWDGARATITHNYIIDNKAFQYGGGINVTGASPTISGNTIISNTAYYGGGMDMSSATAELTGNVILSNLASIHGGGLYLRNGSSASIFANSVLSNTAYYYGGGIYMDRSAPSISGNTMQSNWADSGGGIYVDRSSPVISQNSVVSNTVFYFGGGIYINGSSATLTNNTISNNTATVGGGGLTVRGASWPVIKTNIITENAVGFFGGGVYIFGSGPSLVNNLVARNASSSWAGGIYVDIAWPVITNNTVISNSLAGNGEGIYMSAGSSPTITNNIIVSNTYGIVATNPATPTITRNNVWGNSAGDFIGVAPGDNVSANPLFVRGMDGPLYLSQIAAGQPQNSPSVDAGTDSAENVGLADRTTATYGFPDGGRVDMGYHYRALYYRAYLPLILSSQSGARPLP